MKKKFSILTAAALVLAMTFAFTGCGAKDAEPAEAPAATEESVAETEDAIVEETTEAAAEETTEAVETETETAAEETTEAATEEATTEEATETAVADGMSVEEWVNSEEMQAVIKAMSDSQDGMSIRLFAADDKTVAFSFTLAEQLPIANEEEQQSVATLFEAAMDAQGDTFTEMRNELVAETGIDDVVVRIEYLNADGTTLYSVDYAE